ncbi:MAG: hypothetical protein HC770_07475 [Pseudanabaena sp. CRU_2_10]|nr:hypothetical protein [Pseudanabaena sp. CRU_2_10]
MLRIEAPAVQSDALAWDLPPGLLKRQSFRELERAVMELRRSGFGEAEIGGGFALLRCILS